MSGEQAGQALPGGIDMATFVADFFEEQGWTRNQAAGISANLGAESAYNPKALGDAGRARGIAQWHPDRQKAFEQWAGFNLRDERADLVKQLEFVQYELTEGAEQRAGKLLRAAQTAEEAGATVSRYYERPAQADAAAAIRGAAAVQITQKTEINVNGTGDPVSTANAVGANQDRVNQDMVRNMSSAVN
ncbi:hypothetical protein D3C77_501950 [compost metagenome]